MSASAPAIDLPGFIVSARRWLLLASLLLAAGLSLGLARLELINDYKVFFDPADPQLLAHEAIQDAYTKSDNIAFILGVDDGDLFTRERLGAIEQLTARLWQLPRAVRVDSITNFQYSESQGDDLHVFALLEGAADFDTRELQRRRQLALSEPALLDSLLARDGRTTAINVRVQLPDESSTEFGDAMADVVNAGRSVAAAFGRDNPDVTVHLLGVTVIDQVFQEETIADLITLVPLMLAVIIGLTAILLRSALATTAIVAVIGVTVPAAMGLAGWLGLDLNMVNVAAPTIILTLCVSDGVHILVSHLEALRDGAAPEAALREALAINLKPVFLTSATTAIGFACLNFSDSPPFRELGLITSGGVLLAFLFTLALVPAFALRMTGQAALLQEARWSHHMSALADRVLRHRRACLAGGLLLGLGLIAAAPRNVLTDSTIHYFAPDTPVRRAADYLQARLTGMDRVSYSLAAGGPGGVADPAYLEQVEAFAAWYRQQPEVADVSSITDVMKRLNRNMHGDDPNHYRLPASRALAAQYLLLYELSLPFGLDLNDQINFDKSATRFVARLRHVKAKDIIAVDERAQAWLRQNAPALATPAVGVSMMFAHIGQNNIRSMFRGSAVALAGVLLSLVIALGSARLGLLSLVPNMWPALIAFGIWGLTVGEINLAAAAIFSITMGIVVDDTVHFLSKYLHARRTLNLSPEDAVRHAFSTVGAALVFTTIVLGLGFLTLALSDFAVNALTGRLVSMTIAIALAYDLLVLPALLVSVDRWLRLRN